jgi:hypothetical protein
MHDSRRYRDSAAECYWRLKKHPNLIAENFISLWPSHGSRWPVSMRQ